jgi:hypothetical protein
MPPPPGGLRIAPHRIAAAGEPRAQSGRGKIVEINQLADPERLRELN